MKAQSVKKSPISSSRGMSLGWRLGLSTAVIITLVIGMLTFFQQWHEISQDWKDRDRLLGESLIPIASDLESAKSLEEVRAKFTSIQQALKDRGLTDYHIDLYDEERRLIVSSSGQNSDPPRWTLHASVPIHSTLLPRERGTLSVWKDGSRFKAEVKQRWVLWALDIGVTVLCILVSLQIAYQYLIARPLRHLMKNIHHMEMGYWEGFGIPQGAWEMQWLAYRFQSLGSKLEETMKRLIEAERLALLDSHPNPHNIRQEVIAKNDTASNDTPASSEAIDSSENERSQRAMRLHYLMEKCCFLESQTPVDPTAQISAREVWEQDVVEAERLCEMGLKCRLENAAFRILNPDAYEQLSRELAAMTSLRRGWVKERKKEIRKVLEKHQLSCLEIQHRVKPIGSLWRKIQSKGLTLEQIHDIFAFCIIVPAERDCYLTLDAIHQYFNPKLLRFKDYITTPKANGYQSIHTSVQDAGNFVFEVQIRTEKMHKQAEGGTAAHWYYKGEQVKLGASTWLSKKWSRLKAVLGLCSSP